jgi:DegT/DnrJ/EryC1/StrS aminotransferase family protein
VTHPRRIGPSGARASSATCVGASHAIATSSATTALHLALVAAAIARQTHMIDMLAAELGTR